MRMCYRYTVSHRGYQYKPIQCVCLDPVLGPLLFLIYIDEVASSVTHSNIIMYADDIAMYKVISNPIDYTYLQEDILSLFSRTIT